MRRKIKSLVAWFLVLLQCVSLLPLSAFAANEKGTISSSFTYEKPAYNIKVVDSYYDGDGVLERDETREEKQYKEGEEYEYKALKPDGYMLNGDETVSGVAAEDTEVVFRYDKLTKAYVTFSYSEELCDYLNETLGFGFSPDDIVARQQVKLGEEDNFNVHFDDLEEFCDLDGVYRPNISSFRTYYYDKHADEWDSDARYLGYPIEGLREDYNIEIERNEHDENVPVQNCIDFNFRTHFSDYIGVDRETMSCCHVVLGMDGFNLVRTKDMLGVYRTVIEDMDASDDIESWYTNGYSDVRFLSSFENVKNYPDDFTLVEEGTRLRVWEPVETVYYGRDKGWNNKDVIRTKDGWDFEVGRAPTVKGYKCVNPNSPREFSCIYGIGEGRPKYGFCYYYDYEPAVTYEMTVRDKFVDESGEEVEVEGYSGVRFTEYVPEGEPYSYRALSTDPIEGYLLTGDSIQTGIADSDKEIVFIYEKQPVITITVKDRFYSASGVEERTDTRQVDTYEYGEDYYYGSLDETSDGYQYLYAYIYPSILDDDGCTDDNYGSACYDRDVIFVYQKEPGCTITVKDKYIDRFSNEIKTDTRCTENKYIGEGYEYDCASYDESEYVIVDDGEYYVDEWGDFYWEKRGRVTGDKEIVFTYRKIAKAYVTVSYGQELCDFLNSREDSGEIFDPDTVIEKFNVTLGVRCSEQYDDLGDFEPFCLNLTEHGFDNSNIGILSFSTYYYTGSDWSSDYYYIGLPVDGVAKDPYVNLKGCDMYDEYGYYVYDYKWRFNLTTEFPLDLPAEPDTDICCHIVLDMDNIVFLESGMLHGVYRTVIDEMDEDADIESWYSLKISDDKLGRVTLASDVWEDVQKRPDDFEFVENGTTLMRLDARDDEGNYINDVSIPALYQKLDDSGNIVYYRWDNNEVFDSSDVMEAPKIEGYKCVNPNSSRIFWCITSWDTTGLCFYYDYIPVVTHDITVKDKFIDESGVEEKVDIRQVDPVPEDDEYTYEALDPIPDGYKLVSDPTVTDTSTEDKEVVFIYQKIPKYTITVKDVFKTEAGAEESVAVRQEDELYEGSSYNYSALNPVPDGYELVGASDYAGVVGSDLEIIFTYCKKIEVIPNTHSMIVRDKYVDIDGSVISINERVNTVLGDFEEYTFTALNPEGYEVVGASVYAGRITSDMEIIFVYQKKAEEEKPVNHTFKIVDEYCDADGNVVETVERQVDSLPEGSEYRYTALTPTPDGYVLVSEPEYSGVVTEDMVIVFKYQDASARFVTIKGYLTYKNSEPVANKKVEVHSTVRTAFTDANGYYEINNVETGSHKFTVFNDDGTDLVTCDIVITKDGQDTVAVTYKMENTDVTIDMSVTDVLEIDGVLPLYTLEVIDKYYDESNTLVKSELRESLSAVKYGTAYSYDALSVEGYTVTSAANYSGVVEGDMTLIFEYRKNKAPDTPKPDTPKPDKPKPDPDPTPDEPESKYFTITVIDNYYDSNALLIGSSVRLTEIKSEGSAYFYEAKPVPNFTLVGNDHYSGYVYSNITLAFAYKSVAQPKDSVITVIDRLVDEEGNEDDKVRVTETKKQGDPYNYEAIPVDGYEVVGSSSYSGVVVGDLTLVFTYVKSAEKAKEYVITVIDKFITDIPMNEFIIDESNKSGISDGLNTFNTYNYAKEGGKYIYMVRRELRCRDTFTEGAAYIYNALDLKGYSCISEKSYSGVVNSDLELEFVYAHKGLKKQDIPYNVYISKPEYPDAPEAKTGDLDENETNKLPYIFVVVLFAGVGMAAYIGRRRFYK